MQKGVRNTKKAKANRKGRLLTKEHQTRQAIRMDAHGSEKQESRRRYHRTKLSDKAQLLLLEDEKSALSESQERVQRVVDSN